MTEHEAKTLKELIEYASKNKAIVVDFHATWCGPCVKIGPYIIKKCQENGITLVKVNVDDNQEAAQKFGVTAMPTFAVLNEKGEALLTKTGGTEAIVNEIIEFALKHK
ncbi:uncharacterized protein LOC116245563 [Nymphaea colorata]|nr:uncharacterized protein LOC116245563 [Nymphaea colorata]